MYRYRSDWYRYNPSKFAQNVGFSSIFPFIATQISSILYIHIKTTPNSSCNLFSTQIIFHYISFFKTFHELLPKTILIWVITHTQTKTKDFLEFVLNPNSITCHLTMNPTSKGGFHTHLVPYGVLPTLISRNPRL